MDKDIILINLPKVQIIADYVKSRGSTEQVLLLANQYYVDNNFELRKINQIYSLIYYLNLVKVAMKKGNQGSINLKSLT